MVETFYAKRLWIPSSSFEQSKTHTYTLVYHKIKMTMMSYVMKLSTHLYTGLVSCIAVSI